MNYKNNQLLELHTMFKCKRKCAPIKLVNLDNPKLSLQI